MGLESLRAAATIAREERGVEHDMFVLVLRAQVVQEDVSERTDET